MRESKNASVADLEAQVGRNYALFGSLDSYRGYRSVDPIESLQRMIGIRRRDRNLGLV